MGETDPLKHLATRKLAKQTRARAGVSGLVGRSHHHNVDIVATRELSRTDPSTVELAAQAIQGRRQGKEQRQRKRTEGDKGKGKGQLSGLSENPSWDSHLAICRTGTRRVTHQS